MLFAYNIDGESRASDISEGILISQMLFAHSNIDSESSALNSHQKCPDQSNNCCMK